MVNIALSNILLLLVCYLIVQPLSLAFTIFQIFDSPFLSKFSASFVFIWQLTMILPGHNQLFEKLHFQVKNIAPVNILYCYK